MQDVAATTEPQLHRASYGRGPRRNTRDAPGKRTVWAGCPASDSARPSRSTCVDSPDLRRSAASWAKRAHRSRPSRTMNAPRFDIAPSRCVVGRRNRGLEGSRASHRAQRGRADVGSSAASGEVESVDASSRRPRVAVGLRLPGVSSRALRTRKKLESALATLASGAERSRCSSLRRARYRASRRWRAREARSRRRTRSPATD